MDDASCVTDSLYMIGWWISTNGVVKVFGAGHVYVIKAFTYTNLIT